jgi:MFS family permease
MTRFAFWSSLLASAVLLGLTVGYRQTFGLFLPAVTGDLGIGREAFGLALAVMNLTWGLAAPLAGMVADRHGAGRMMAAGALVYAVGLVGLATAGSAGQLIWSGALIGLGLSGAGFTVSLAAAGRLAPETGRTQAIGTVSLGGSIGQFLALPVVHLLILGVGWQVGLGWLAASMALAAGAGLLVRDRISTQPGSFWGSAGTAVRDALRVPSFGLLTVGFFVCGFHLAFLVVHLPAFLVDRGLDASVGAVALTLIGLANIVGTILFTRAGARWSRRRVLAGLYLARTVLMGGFVALPVTEVTVYGFAVLMGLTWLATVPLTSALVADLFGTARLSTLFGVVFLGHQLGSFAGAWFAGAVYDRFGSYDLVWGVSVAIGLAAVGLHLAIRLPETVPQLA